MRSNNTGEKRSRTALALRRSWEIHISEDRFFSILKSEYDSIFNMHFLSEYRIMMSEYRIIFGHTSSIIFVTI